MEEKQLKQRFFAQYLGSKHTWRGEEYGSLSGDDLDYERDLCVVLKDLTKITNEDAQQIGHIGSQEFVEDLYHFGEVIIALNEGDVLRSLGYLIPFMHLSIQDLLNRGWAKYE